MPYLNLLKVGGVLVKVLKIKNWGDFSPFSCLKFIIYDKYNKIIYVTSITCTQKSTSLSTCASLLLQGSDPLSYSFISANIILVLDESFDV